MSDSKTLVAFFSLTGNTEKAARRIAELAGADIHEIKTNRSYSKKFLKCALQAGSEKIKKARPSLDEAPGDLESYDEILIGYPAWCFTCPMAVLSFVEQNDLSGKRVRLFNTSMGSGAVGLEDVKKSCNGDIIDSTDVTKFTDDELEDWIRSA